MRNVADDIGLEGHRRPCLGRIDRAGDGSGAADGPVQLTLRLFDAEDRLRFGQRFHRFLRSEEHTSELQSLMRISYAVFCLKKKTNIIVRYNQYECRVH